MVRPVPVIMLFLLFLPLALQSQSIPHTIVRGRVLDDSTGSPLPLTNVFVSNSTIGAAADTEGRFELRGVPLGTHEIAASIVGYASQTKKLRCTDTTVYKMEFRLRPRAVEIQGLDIGAKEPVEWKQQFSRFVKLFFGTTPNAAQCKLLNPEVLDFAVGGTGMFTATAREPLIVENKALGYRIHCLLSYFVEKPTTLLPVVASGSTRNSRTIEYLCRTRFTPLESQDPAKLHPWKENRRITYYGSERHFLSSLVSKNSDKDQFEVYEIYSTHSRTVPVLRIKVGADSLLSPGEFAFERRLTFGETLEIVYNGGDEPQRSMIKLERPSVIVYVNGTLPDPLSITTYGFWATQRVADILPIDFRPED